MSGDNYIKRTHQYILGHINNTSYIIDNKAITPPANIYTLKYSHLNFIINFQDIRLSVACKDFVLHAIDFVLKT